MSDFPYAGSPTLKHNKTKYYHVVAVLDSSSTRRVMGLLRDLQTHGKYEALKAQLRHLFQLSDPE